MRHQWKDMNTLSISGSQDHKSEHHADSKTIRSLVWAPQLMTMRMIFLQTSATAN